MGPGSFRSGWRSRIIDVGDGANSCLEKANGGLDEFVGESTGAEREGQREEQEDGQVFHRCEQVWTGTAPEQVWVFGEKKRPGVRRTAENSMFIRDDSSVGLLEFGDFLEDGFFALGDDFAVLVDQLVVRDSKPT